MSLRPLILERFLDPKSTQDREKMLSKSLHKSGRFLISFLFDVGSILDPLGHLKIVHVSLIFAPGATLGPSWRQESGQSAPRQLQKLIFQEFGTILGSNLQEFLKIFDVLFHIIFDLISYRMFTSVDFRF